MSPSISPQSNGVDKQQKQHQNGTASPSSAQHFPLPALAFQVRDLKHAGSRRFLDAVNATDCVAAGVQNVLRLLYHTPRDPDTVKPSTTSVTLILEDIPGVAYTVVPGADVDVKEVHFSLNYIAGIDASLAVSEITGVVTHELVHCFQYNGLGTAPGGLIEGIADWVRLRCNLAPPHWKKEAAGNWDAGYQHTAYFLDYLEQRFGSGTVRQINQKLRGSEYIDGVFWLELLGQDVNQLYIEYVQTLTK